MTPGRRGKLGESYHCPQLTTWNDHPGCSGKRWLQGQQVGQVSWGQGTESLRESQVTRVHRAGCWKGENYMEEHFPKVPLEYWVSSSVSLEVALKPRKEPRVKRQRTITRSLQGWHYFLLYQSRQTMAILRPSNKVLRGVYPQWYSGISRRTRI